MMWKQRPTNIKWKLSSEDMQMKAWLLGEQMLWWAGPKKNRHDVSRNDDKYLSAEKMI